MEKLKIGIVGAGQISRAHLESYKKVANAEIVAICDINEKTLNATADMFDIKKRYTSETEMIKNENLDAADICVWNCNHAKCAIEALDAGLHVLCEKPMAYNSKQAIEMQEAAKRNNRLLMIGFVLRFGTESKIAKDFIDNGYLGDIYFTKATYLRRHGSPGGWFGKKELSGGGPVIDLGVHVIDLTRSLMGSPKPVSVYAVTSDRLGDRKYLKNDVGWKPDDASDDDIFDVEDFATALIRYDNGSCTLLETSYSLNGDEVTQKEFFGTKGGIKIDNEGKMKIYSEYNGYLADITPKLENYKYGTEMFVDEMQHFTDCAQKGIKCMATAEDGIEVMKILDAIYESAKTGHEVIL